MATRDFRRCIAALNHAAGRELTAEEVQDALDRIGRTAKDIQAGRVKAEGDANLATPEGIIRHAAGLEAKKMIADAETKARRAVMDAEVAQRLQAELGAIKAGGISDVEAVRRLLINRPDGRADAYSLETRYMGIQRYMQRKLVDTWEAMGDGFLDYLQRPEKARLLLREMRGEDTGDAMAQKGAQAWRDAAEEARQWFNDKGGNVGHLEDWSNPQHHSQDMVARAAFQDWEANLPPGRRAMEKALPVTEKMLERLGNKRPTREANQKAWVDFILPLLNRERYTDLAGRQMTEPELRDFLNHAWESIATGGVNKIEPGQFQGKGARANRHTEERQLHFKDADSQIAYWERFGDRTLPDVLMGHIDTMAKDIAFMEHFGSNPTATYALLRDQARIAATTADPTKTGPVNVEIRSLDKLFNYAAGITAPIADQRIANMFGVVHSLNTAGLMGSAMWSSAIGDRPMFEAMARLNNLPELQMWQNTLRLLNPANAEDRRLLRRQGLMLEYMQQSMYRFGDELGKSSLSAKLANSVVKMSGLAAMNDLPRGGWALTAMDTIGHLVSTKKFTDIGPQDMRLLQSYGITEADWKVWQKAELDDLGHGNNTALTPEAVMRIPDDVVSPDVKRDAAVKLLGALTSESKLAVIEPGWQERAAMYGGLDRGTMRGELTRAFWQFKSFPFTQFHKIMDVGMSRPTIGGKIAFVSAMTVMLTMAGAMMIQVQEMLAGKDPRPMNTWEFWAAAFLKGGSLGIYGDFLFSQDGKTKYGSGPLEAIAGPTIGMVADLATIASEVRGKVSRGEDPHVAGKVLQTTKRLVPFQNYWPTKAATDHLIFQNAQEALNPGYLENMRRRTEREYGNSWWWTPGPGAPDRLPNLGNAAGR